MARRLLPLVIIAALTACTPAPTPQERAPPVGLWEPAPLAELIHLAEAAPTHGLPPETAALEEIARLQSEAGESAVARDQLDAAADALLISLARNLSHGASDPAVADPHWLIPAEPEILASTLLARRGAGVSPALLLQEAAPQSEQYAALREELARVMNEPEGALDAARRSRESRIVSLRASLERWRWLPHALPLRRVEARIAQFEVVMFDDGRVSRRHAAIVGARRTPTPAFAAAITSITMNPYWEPPASIARNELLPRFRRDPAAASREGYEAVDARGAVIASPDWSARPFPYRLRQRPGQSNALGRIRFDLPNPHAIYLHDTPSRALFARTDRALSHGCIRVQDPLALAEAVLNAREWTIDALSAETTTERTRALGLASPLPIYVLYMTATANDGAVTYADDVYERDSRVVAALEAPDTALAAGASRLEGECSH